MGLFQALAMIKTYSSIAEFIQSIGRSFDQDFDCTIHRFEKLHGKQARKSPSFRTAYHAFLLISRGSGSYTIDQRSYPLGPRSYYFTNPGHVKSFVIEVPLEGYILTFTDAFLQSFYAGSLAEEFPFLYESTTPVMTLGERDYASLTREHETLLETYAERGPFRARIMAHQVIAMLYRTKGLLRSHRERIGPEDRPGEITLAFQRLLTERFRRREDDIFLAPQVREIADKLAVSPAYLSEVIKSETGQSPKYWIDDRLITEAQTLLLNGTDTVSQIAYHLGFEDASNFSRFFRRRVGESPNTYRRSGGK